MERPLTFFAADLIWSHPENDRDSRRLALATLMVNGLAKPVELERALGIPHRTAMHWQRQLKTEGAASFFRGREVRSFPKMTADVVGVCELALAEGLSVRQAAARAGVKPGTLGKAISQGRVRRSRPDPAPSCPAVATTRSERSQSDASCEMGKACSRPSDRLLAAIGMLEHAESRYEPCLDVAFGGVLAGLPALGANGLFHRIGDFFRLPKGFYGIVQLFMFFGLMALARIRRPEGLRYAPPGELGKLLGLDRCPEAKTVRSKIASLSGQETAAEWGRELSRLWMEEDPAEAGYLYVDGHVRVYHGTQADLPRRYVSRERLCLRGTTDYWINDAIGRPFFVVSRTVNDGMAHTLVAEIVPRLVETVPGQPLAAELDADPELHRFVMVFDREGSNAKLVRQLWEQRIAVITYRKRADDRWPESEFSGHSVRMPMGNVEEMRLAERQTVLGSGAAAIPVREVRKLTETGHQTAIISTLRKGPLTAIAARMFTRWCQENYFSYMMQNFDLDGLVEYGTEGIPGTESVVNPAWRTLDKTIKSKATALARKQARLGRMHMADDGTPEQSEKEIADNAKLLEAIAGDQAELDALKLKRKGTPKHILYEQLPEAEKFLMLAPLRKQFCDTIKMIAYRAETALVQKIRPHMAREDDARALLCQLFISSADIIPNPEAGTLNIRIHGMANPTHDRAVQALLEALNQIEFDHPATGDRIVYSLA